MKKIIFPILVLLWSLVGCIGDDIIDDEVDPTVRISNPIDTIQINTTYQFTASFFNNVGKEEAISLNWTTSDESIISITNDGLATANANGTTTISVEGTAPTGESVLEERMVSVGGTTVVASSARTGTLETTSSYLLEGSFELKDDNGTLILSLEDDYKASTALPGLFVYLTNNPNTTSGAFEIGAVTNFNGAHAYELPNSVGLMDYQYVLYFCKPFNVKVGDGEFDN